MSFGAARSWEARAAELERDLARLRHILDSPQVAARPGSSARHHVLWVAPLEAELEALRGLARSGKYGANAWRELGPLKERGAEVSAKLLTLLGGAAVLSDSGPFLSLARDWFEPLMARAGLRAPNLAFGMRLEYHEDAEVTYLPFLDADPWQLPLLGRAAGLAALADGSPYRRDLDAALPPLRRSHHDLVFAEMLTTALEGPVYPWALLACESDLRDPDGAGLRRDTPGAPELSSSVRMAACIATLAAIDAEKRQWKHADGPYTEPVKNLTDAWHILTAAAGAKARPLDSVSHEYAACHQVLFRILKHRLDAEMAAAAKTWSSAVQHAAAVLERRAPASELSLPERVSAMWLLRRARPHEMAAIESTLSGSTETLAFRPSRSRDLVSTVAHIRLTHLERRLELIKRSPHGSSGPFGRAVSGRLLRQLGPVACELDGVARQLRRGVRSSVWLKLALAARDIDAVGSEVLEILGGLQVRSAGLDTDRFRSGRGLPLGDLAEKVLADWSALTGVNWDGRIIFGQAPFMDTRTDVIRLRFPSWSLYDLPLLAHEFGHLVSFATPEFAEYKQHHAADERVPEGELRQRMAQLDEIFADAFALYCCGPAFACCVVLLQLDPHRPHRPRRHHLSHHDRAGMLLELLRLSNEQSGEGFGPQGPYGQVIDVLAHSWRTAVAAATPDAGMPEDALARVNRWARAISRIVDRAYRAGARHTPDRWARAAYLGRKLGQASRRGARATVSLDPPVSSLDAAAALWWLRAGLWSEPHDPTTTALGAEELLWEAMASQYDGKVR